MLRLRHRDPAALARSARNLLLSRVPALTTSKPDPRLRHVDRKRPRPHRSQSPT